MKRTPPGQGPLAAGGTNQHKCRKPDISNAAISRHPNATHYTHAGIECSIHCPPAHVDGEKKLNASEHTF